MCDSPLFEKCERHFPQCASESSQLRLYIRLKSLLNQNFLFPLQLNFYELFIKYLFKLHTKSTKKLKKCPVKIEARKNVSHCEAVVAGFWKSLSSATIAFHPTLNPTYQAEMIWMVCWSSINLFKKIQRC